MISADHDQYDHAVAPLCNDWLASWPDGPRPGRSLHRQVQPPRRRQRRPPGCLRQPQEAQRIGFPTIGGGKHNFSRLKESLTDRHSMFSARGCHHWGEKRLSGRRRPRPARPRRGARKGATNVLLYYFVCLPCGCPKLPRLPYFPCQVNLFHVNFACTILGNGS
jgi:hypothetical protein